MGTFFNKGNFIDIKLIIVFVSSVSGAKAKTLPLPTIILKLVGNEGGIFLCPLPQAFLPGYTHIPVPIP